MHASMVRCEGAGADVAVDGNGADGGDVAVDGDGGGAGSGRGDGTRVVVVTGDEVG